jgi:hypothetical protein
MTEEKYYTVEIDWTEETPEPNLESARAFFENLRHTLQPSPGNPGVRVDLIEHVVDRGEKSIDSFRIVGAPVTT